MKSPLLTSSSNFGKYLPKNKSTFNKSASHPECNQEEKIISSIISLKQNYIHESPFVSCRFDSPGNRLYLVDNKCTLIYLNLQDNSFSTLKNCHQVTNFTIDGNNSLSLLYASPKSQLFKVSFDHKKPQKLLNLNMSKILAFQRNYLREMLLVLDYKLLFLYDLTKKIDNTKNKIKSLKAGYNQVFTNACFSSNNRFIILAVKNIQIRIVQIMDFTLVHQIKLPFEVADLKIEVSYDSKRIAVYGNCSIIFFIILSQQQPGQYNYQLIQVPFVKSITQLKFTYENDIIFLGSDQILYGINNQHMDIAVPIFNHEYQIRMMAFDISLDCHKIAIVSNRNIYQLCFKKGLRHTLVEKKLYKQLQYRINGFQGYKQGQLLQNSKPNNFQMNEIKEDVLQEQNSKDFQYEDEDQSEDDLQRNEEESPKIILNTAAQSKIKSYPKFVENSMPMNPAVLELKGYQHSSKTEISYIFTHLSSRYRNVSLGQNNNIVRLIAKLHSKFKGSYLNCLGVLDVIFNNISAQFQKLDHYCLILCPEIISIIQKRFELNFSQFFKDLLVTVCMDYFNEQQWVKVVNWTVGSHEDTQNLPIFAIAMLKTISYLISNGSNNWSLLANPTPQLYSLGLSFEGVLFNLEKIFSDTRFVHLFRKQQEDFIKIQGKNYNRMLLEEQNELQQRESDRQSALNSLKLQQLILKQQKIKNQLTQLKRNKPI